MFAAKLALRSATILAFSLTVVCGSSAQAAARAPVTAANEAAPPQMRLARAAPAPAGYVDFCRRQAADCEAGVGIAATSDASNITGSIGSAAPVRSSPAAPASEWLASSLRAVDLAAASGRRLDTLAIDWTKPLGARTRASSVVDLQLGGSTVAFDLESFMLAAAKPAEALRDTASDTPARTLTASLTANVAWDQVNKINRDINQAIAPRTDIKARGVEEYWSTPLAAGERYGDCEDYVLEKRRALLKAGVSPKAMSIAVVSTFKGERHAVLLVKMDDNEYVLDNLSSWIVPWYKTSYRWHERQIAGSPNLWAAIANPATPARRNAQILLANLN